MYRLYCQVVSRLGFQLDLRQRSHHYSLQEYPRMYLLHCQVVSRRVFQLGLRTRSPPMSLLEHQRPDLLCFLAVLFGDGAYPQYVLPRVYPIREHRIPRPHHLHRFQSRQRDSPRLNHLLDLFVHEFLVRERPLCIRW